MSISYSSTTPSFTVPALNIITGKELFLLKAIHRRLRLLEKYPSTGKEAQEHAARNESRLAINTEVDIPQVIKGLSSEDDDEFSKATGVIASIANYQFLLFHDEVVPLIPSIFALISAASNDVQKSTLIDLLRNVGLASSASFSALVKHTRPRALVDVLTGSLVVRKSAVRLLEGMLVRAAPEIKSSLETLLMEPFHAHFAAPSLALSRPELNTRLIGETMGTIKALASALCQGRSQFSLALLKTGALEFLLQIAATPSSPGPLGLRK
ncbi:hypothetical protein FA13DRAFT_1856272 [Coprinellus micaceus]|uniref:ARM repeat-containing protein n=1 Tax=Coprinellus micaceus TaxID=71717 RepID=A0A4Y7SC17_COPMI|nr:hypothetical protein FA13DRAFT_1856272 [Coprinellus micaceus]